MFVYCFFLLTVGTVIGNSAHGTVIFGRRFIKRGPMLSDVVSLSVCLSVCLSLCRPSQLLLSPCWFFVMLHVFSTVQLSKHHNPFLAILLWPLYFAAVVSSFFLLYLFFPRLYSLVADWMSTVLPHMMWSSCEFRMQVWNVLHAARWKYRTQNFFTKSRHLRTIAELVWLYFCS